jgi:hypothetical protein
VTAAGVPVDAEVVAESVALEGGGSVMASAQTDSSGVYRIYVPAGRYLLRVGTWQLRSYLGPNGLVLGRSDARMLTSEEGSASRVDIRAAAVTLRLTLGYGHAGERIGASLIPVDHDVGWPIFVPGDSTGSEQTEFRFAPVIAGRYRIRVHEETRRRISQFWLPGVYEESDAATIDVPDGGETFAQYALGTPGLLKGALTGASREFGFPSTIELEAESNQATVAVVSTEDGSFALPVVAPLRAKVFISSGGIERWYGGWTFDEATVFDLRPGLAVPLEIRDCGIEGRLDRTNNGDAAVGVCSTTGTFRGSAYAPTDGTFRLANLPAGTYTLFIRGGPTWVDQWYDGADTVATATPIVLYRDGEIAHVEVHLLDGGGIRGTILGGDETRIARAQVVAEPAPYNYYQYGGDADGEGNYHIPYVPNGDYRVRVNLPGSPTVWYPGVLDPDSTTIVSIRHFETVGGIDIHIPR